MKNRIIDVIAKHKLPKKVIAILIAIILAIFGLFFFVDPDLGYYPPIICSPYDSAIAGYTYDLEKKPNDLYALYNRGRVYYFKGNYDQAINDLETVLKIDPNNTEAKQLLEEVWQTKTALP
jgi:tetratricopeptide (TPR) repeat protein